MNFFFPDYAEHFKNVKQVWGSVKNAWERGNLLMRLHTPENISCEKVEFPPFLFSFMPLLGLVLSFK